MTTFFCYLQLSDVKEVISATRISDVESLREKLDDLDSITKKLQDSGTILAARRVLFDGFVEEHSSITASVWLILTLHIIQNPLSVPTVVSVQSQKENKLTVFEKKCIQGLLEPIKQQQFTAIGLQNMSLADRLMKKQRARTSTTSSKDHNGKYEVIAILFTYF